MQSHIQKAAHGLTRPFCFPAVLGLIAVVMLVYTLTPAERADLNATLHTAPCPPD